MKTIKKTLILSLVGLGLLITIMSCNKFLDINTSPLTAQKVEPKLLFGYAITAWDVNKNSGDSWIPLGLMTQSFASGGVYGWGKGDVYELSVYSIGNTWKVVYSTAGNNLKQAIEIAESASPRNNNAAAQSKIVLAQVMYEATTLFGDIPFSESWNPEEFPYPKFDSQKDVLYKLIALLDEAIVQLDESDPLMISDYDIYYKGDLDKWRKLANSLKLKIYLVMVDAEPAVAANIGALIKSSEDMISNPSESWLHPYYDTEINQNPKYRLLKYFENGVNNWFFANSNVFKYMDENDPRIPQYYEKGSEGNYVPVESEVTATAKNSLISSYILRPDAPSVILSYQEICLLKAEVYARGIGVAKDLDQANILFKEGVKAACLFYDADQEATVDYVNNTLVSLTSVADPVEAIHLQQWIDLMDRPMEAFVQWRRSGVEGKEVPQLKVPIGVKGNKLIRRWKMSPEETQSNPNAPKIPKDYFEKMWFDL